MNHFIFLLVLAIIIIVPILILLEALAYWVVVSKKGPVRKLERLVQTIPLMLMFIFWLIFAACVWDSEGDYRIPIDPVDNSYSPLSHEHILSIVVYLSLSLWGLYEIWKGGRRPPLLQALLISFVFTGILLCLTIVAQLSGDFSWSGYKPLMFAAPSTQIIVSFWLLIKEVLHTSQWSEGRIFKHRALNYLNENMQRASRRPFAILAALLPVYLFITLVLILFGQEPDSLVKAITQTTEWRFSTQTHPPFLDHRGHYLCTVAAYGSPSLVKPLRLGIRHGNAIIVNRQLLIANAFEDLIQRRFYKLHGVIRSCYDHYGYPISLHINTPLRSNFIYLAMKPVEWLFLVILYSFNEQPEKLINEQYRVLP